jgi:RIO kinase 1
MKIPKRLQPLVDDGVIDSVVRQLMSGKEAMVFVVRCGAESRCAKVYKEADKRSFRQAVDYTENRKTKNSRQARAIAKGTRFGREAQEKAWQSAEVGALFRLAAAGVRVPRPYNFHAGVLLMELVTDDEGNAAPRLNDVKLTPEIAIDLHRRLIREVVRMLSAGVVHGDLSEFNILLGADGPVIIDLPQAVDAAGNNHAPRMLVRDGSSGDMHPSFWPPITARKYGRSTSRASCTRMSSSPGTSSASRRRSISTASCARSTPLGSRKPPANCDCRNASRRSAPDYDESASARPATLGLISKKRRSLPTPPPRCPTVCLRHEQVCAIAQV